jgi:hypothetical protein
LIFIGFLPSGTDITRQAITIHLDVLAAAGAGAQRQSGTRTTVGVRTFEPAQVDEARRSLQVIAEQWDHALAKLKRAVET